MEGQKAKTAVAKSKEVQAIISLSRTEAGQKFLRVLMHTCGYQRSSISGDPTTHEINIYGTIFNESRRRLWLDIRAHIPADILLKIEEKIEYNNVVKGE